MLPLFFTDESPDARFSDSTLLSPIKSQSQPVFAQILSNFRQDIAALPGVSRWGTSSVVDFLRQPVADGLSSVLLFGVPDKVNTPASVALQYACVCKFFGESVSGRLSGTYKPDQSLRDH